MEPKTTLSAISEAIAMLSEGGIGKKNWNEQQRFWFRGIDDILSTLSPVLAKVGLVILPVVREIQSTEFTSSNQKATKFNRVVVTVDYNIYYHGGVSYTVTFVGEAMDTGDKATAKALSMAYKQMAIQTFCIPVDGEEDPDTESPGNEPADEPIRRPQRIQEAPQQERQVQPLAQEPDQSRKASDGEIAFVRRKVKELGREEKSAMKWLGIQEWDQMTAAHFVRFKEYLADKSHG